MVGIVSCYFKTNYGSALQAFATQAILDKMDIGNETINIGGFHREISAGKRKYYMRNAFNIPMYQAKKGFVRHIVQTRLDPKGFGADIGTRRQAFKRFEERHFRLSYAHESKSHLSKSCEKYAGVLLGSDQLWLPLNIEGDYYTLNFVPENINKVAYATSFGVKSIPAYQHEKTKRFLNRINHLSTREASGQKIIYELIGKNAPVVCDPSMLLTWGEWLSLREPSAGLKKPYIFCYFMGDNKIHREFVNKLKRKTGYAVTVLRHLDEYIPHDNDFGDFAPYDVDPLDFIHLINNAAIVCTDSVHGTVLSRLANREFYSFRRFRAATKESTNNRVEDLLEKMGLKDRMLTGEELPEDVMKGIAYNGVNALLESWRGESLEYLASALNQ